ncbi:hypothetical protein BH18ACI5_BH18ACI5_20910 [soil metagenome]
MALVWDYNYLIPYSYIAIDYTRTVQSRVKHVLPAPAFAFALGYFLIFCIAGYWLYATKSDKGQAESAPVRVLAALWRERK